MPDDPSFAPPLADLATSTLAPPGVTLDPAPGQGLSLSETLKIPNAALPVPIVWTVSQTSSSFTTVSTTYALPGTENVTRALIPDAKKRYDSGLRPQVAVFARMANGTAATTFAAARLSEVANGDTVLTTVGEAAEVSHFSTTATYKVATWEDFPFAPTLAHWILHLVVKVSAGTGTYTACGAAFRWVSG